VKEFHKYRNKKKPKNLSQAEIKTSKSSPIKIEVGKLTRVLGNKKIADSILPSPQIKIKIFKKNGYFLIKECDSRKEIFETLSKIGIS